MIVLNYSAKFEKFTFRPANMENSPKGVNLNCYLLGVANMQVKYQRYQLKHAYT